MSSNNVSYIQFDSAFLESNPDKLEELARFYADIWKYDENFGEYSTCPVCHSYYNHQQVEVDGVTSCSDCNVLLVAAWNQSEVVADIQKATRSANFHGMLAFDVESKGIIGFAWAETLDLDSIRASWGSEMVSQIQDLTGNNSVAYFDELAVDPSHRKKYIGATLANSICRWMKHDHPSHIGLLRTHQQSPARLIYEQLGYEVFAVDTQHGGGRVMMLVNPCSDIALLS